MSCQSMGLFMAGLRGPSGMGNHSCAVSAIKPHVSLTGSHEAPSHRRRSNLSHLGRTHRHSEGVCVAQLALA